MRRILGLLLLVTVTMMVTSCLKDSEKFIPYETYIDSSILGVIGDQDNLPVENATVVYEGEDANTNPDGIFIFNDVVVPNSGARLLVQKAGFFDAYRSIDPHADNRSLDVRLKSFGPEYLFLATSGKELTEPSGAGISIGSGVFELPSGDIYTGQVSSYFGVLDALDADVSGAFAASEKGIDGNGQTKLLEHYGTMWTSFQSTNNTDLIIRDGAFITLRFPKPSGSNSPSSLILWKLDESEGYWVEYGIAQLTGDHYEAEVRETGTWSIQRAFDFATLTGRVKNTKGLDLERARIAVSRENSDIIRRVWTDSEGRFEIDYPIREELHISIEDECQTSLYDVVEGPFLGNYELNTIEVETGDTYWRVTGIVTQCNNPTKGIDDGYSFIQTSRYKWITPVEQGGGFSSGMFLCGNNFNVSGHDVVNEKESGRSVVTPEVSCGESCFSVGALIACN